MNISLYLFFTTALSEAVHMPRSLIVWVTRVLKRVACVRVVDWVQASMGVQEKPGRHRAFAVQVWVRG